MLERSRFVREQPELFFFNPGRPKRAPLRAERLLIPLARWATWWLEDWSDRLRGWSQELDWWLEQFPEGRR